MGAASEAKESFGMVPDWLSGMPDAALSQYWSTLSWLMDDTALPAR